MFKWALVILASFLVLGKTNAQSPTCAGNTIYILDTANWLQNPRIYNYNTALPISSSNPTINYITYPSIIHPHRRCLAIAPNFFHTIPAMTFYTVIGAYIYYYNGSTWVNTNHLAAFNSTTTATFLFGSGTSIYGIYYPFLFKYTGTGNSQLVYTFNGSPKSSHRAFGFDCNDNMYVLERDMGPPVTWWLRKYTVSGTLLKTWSVAGLGIKEF
jgi:hypothetical protein